MQRYSVVNLNEWLKQQARAFSLCVIPKDEKRKPPVHKVLAVSESSSASPEAKNKRVSCVCCKKGCESLAKCADF